MFGYGWEVSDVRIDFGSNIEKTLYDVFSKICEKLGHNPSEYTRPGGFDSTVVEWTWIDGGSYLLSRRVELAFGKPFVKIDIFVGSVHITQDDLRKELFGPDPSRLWYIYHDKELRQRLTEYHSKRPSKKRVDRIVSEIANAVKRMKKNGEPSGRNNLVHAR